MQNVMFIGLLLSVEILAFIHAQCNTNPDIRHADFQKDDQCSDVTISCQAGYQMVQLMTCTNDAWMYQKPVCKPGQCLKEPDVLNGNINNEIISRDTGSEYNYTCNREFVKNGREGNLRCNAAGEWEANLICEDCLIRGKIIDTVGQSHSSSAVADLDRCIKNCKSFSSCKALNYKNGYCFMFYVGVESLRSYAGSMLDIIIDKSTCPTIFE